MFQLKTVTHLHTHTHTQAYTPTVSLYVSLFSLSQTLTHSHVCGETSINPKTSYKSNSSPQRAFLPARQQWAHFPETSKTFLAFQKSRHPPKIPIFLTFTFQKCLFHIFPHHLKIWKNSWLALHFKMSSLHTNFPKMLPHVSHYPGFFLCKNLLLKTSKNVSSKFLTIPNSSLSKHALTEDPTRTGVTHIHQSEHTEVFSAKNHVECLRSHSVCQ